MIHKHKTENRKTCSLQQSYKTDPLYVLLENPISIPPITHPATKTPTVLRKTTSGFRSVAESG